MVMIEVPVPPAVRVTLVGDAEQLGGKTAELLLGTQVRVTEPAKPLMEVTVMVSVLPVVAPEVKLSEVGEAESEKDAAVRLTAIFAELTTVEPLVPVSLTLSTPEVPGVVAMVRVLSEELPAVSVAMAGRMVQLPAAVPLAVVIVQPRVTLPAKLVVEATVTTSVLPVVAPEMRV